MSTVSDCGFHLSGPYLLDRYPDVVEVSPYDSKVLLFEISALREVAKGLGVTIGWRGMDRKWVCPICGILERSSCDPAKHRAFYDELEETGERLWSVE